MKPVASLQTATDGDASGDVDHQVNVLVEATVTAHNLVRTTSEIAFIDSRLTGLPEIVSAIPDGTRIVLIDSSSDAVSQITSAIESEQGITGIHIISHGSAGSLQIGNTTLNAETMSTIYRDALEGIRDNLAEGADILIYGCDFGAGEEGAEASALLSELTGADIASSDDDTGSEALGGDWDLEQRLGAIDTAAVDAPEWKGVLAPLTIAATGNPTTSGGNGAGAVGLWTNAGTIGSTPIDIRATVTSASSGATITFATGTGVNADDLWLQITGGTVTVRWEIFAAGSNQTIVAYGDPNFRISDIDGSNSTTTAFPGVEVEAVSPSLYGLTAYTVSNPTNLITGVNGNQLMAIGSVSQNSESTSLVGFDWTNVSSFDVTYTAVAGQGTRYFFHDGDGDLAFVSPVTTYMLSLDLDANNSTTSGTGYVGSYTENGTSVPIVDVDTLITEHSVLGADIGTATVVLTNADDLDQLTVGSLPSGISSSIDTGTPGRITVTLSGLATVGDYQTALGAIRYSNTGENPSTTDRQFQISVTNTIYGTTSNIATSTIHVTATNDAPVATPSTSSGDEDTNISVGLSGTDVDGSVTSVAVTSLPPVGQGVLYYADGTTPVSTSTPLTPAQAANLVFVPSPNFNGTVTIPFTVTDNNGATSASANEVITVNAVNDNPVANDDTVNVNEDFSARPSSTCCPTTASRRIRARR